MRGLLEQMKANGYSYVRICSCRSCINLRTDLAGRSVEDRPQSEGEAGTAVTALIDTVDLIDRSIRFIAQGRPA